MAGIAGSSASDGFAVYDLFAAYGALIDAAEFDAWLDLFAANCTYHIMPRENYDRGFSAESVQRLAESRANHRFLSSGAHADHFLPAVRQSPAFASRLIKLIRRRESP